MSFSRASSLLPDGFATGLVSGVLSYVAVVPLARALDGPAPVVAELISYSPGVIFALFVLAPMARRHRAPRRRALLLVALSVVAYYLAANTAAWLSDGSAYTMACGISGGLGAMLVAGAIRGALGCGPRAHELVGAMLFGVFGGVLFGCALEFPRPDARFLLAGYVFWHSGVAVAFAPIASRVRVRRRLERGALFHAGPPRHRLVSAS